MLRSIASLSGIRVNAHDGMIGNIDNLYICIGTWEVCYAVVDAAAMKERRYILLAPAAFMNPGRATLPVNLSISRIAASPAVDVNTPVTGRRIEEIFKYYEWPQYWVQQPSDGIVTPPPLSIKRNSEKADRMLNGESGFGVNVRSYKWIIGQPLKGSDTVIGTIDDMIVNTVTWYIQYLVVTLRKDFPGKKVMMATDWMNGTTCGRSEIACLLSMLEVRNAPEFNPEEPINRTDSKIHFDFYGREVHA